MSDDPRQPHRLDQKIPVYGQSEEPWSWEADPIEEGVVGPADTGHAAAESGRPSGLTHDERFRTGRLAGLGMVAAIWVLAWPVMIESLLNSLVGITDTWLASQLGVAEADAIGGASYILWFIGLTFMAVGMGATALISRAIGMGRLASANAALGQTVLAAAAVGLLVAITVALMAEPLAALVGLEGGARDAFSGYMRIIAIGVIPGSVLCAIGACARGAGDSLRPLWAMGVRNAVNISASWILSGVDIATAREVDGEIVRHVLLENPFAFDLGIYGIAAGTVIGDIAAVLVVLAMAVRGTWGITLMRRRLIPRPVMLYRLARLAIPNFAETAGMWVGNFILVIFVGWMGAGLLGSHIIAIRLESLSFMPGFAIGTAAATLTGQYLGAGRPDLARKAIWRCSLLASVFMGAFGAAFVLIPEVLVGAMSAQAVHLEHTPPLLVACGVVQVPFAIGIVMRTAMRGAGDVRVAMLLTWMSTYAIRLPAAFLLSGVDVIANDEVGGEIVRKVILENPMPDDFPIQGLAGMWIAMCGDLVIRGLMFFARFLHGGWARIRV